MTFRLSNPGTIREKTRAATQHLAARCCGGNVVSALTVAETDELMLITNKGQMIRTRVSEVRETARNTMGVKLIDLKGTEKLTAIAPVVNPDEEEQAEGGTATPSML